MGRVMEPRNRFDVRADAVSGAEGHIDSGRACLLSAAPGSESEAREQRILQEPGRPARLLVKNGLGPRDHLQVCDRPRALGSQKRIKGHATRYRQVKATKRGGKDTRESESPVVPRKPANESPEELVEGRRDRADGTEGENDGRAPEFGNHLHTNPTDS
jgi:hypothetical protein